MWLTNRSSFNTLPRQILKISIKNNYLSIFICVASFAACAATAHAEGLYKWRDKSGVVTYSQTAPQGVDASTVETVNVTTLTPAQQRAALQLLRKDERTANDYAKKLERSWNRVDAKISVALRDLHKAEAALKTGRAPQPGERLGNAGGGSRLTQAYFDRLQALEKKIDQAKLALDNAYQERNALR